MQPIEGMIGVAVRSSIFCPEVVISLFLIAEPFLDFLRRVNDEIDVAVYDETGNRVTTERYNDGEKAAAGLFVRPAA